MNSRDFPAKPPAAIDPPTVDGRSSLDTHVGKTCSFYLMRSIPSMTSVALPAGVDSLVAQTTAAFHIILAASDNRRHRHRS